MTYELIGIWAMPKGGAHRKTHGNLSWSDANVLGENWARAGADVMISQGGCVVSRIARTEGGCE